MWRWGEAPPHVPAHSGQGLDLAWSALVGLLLLISRPPLLAKANAEIRVLSPRVTHGLSLLRQSRRDPYPP